jgi:CheY-like chemotaxis protein
MKAILFVDDHELLARLSCEILEMQGYRAVSAGRSTITNLREISFFSLLHTPSIPSREMAILSALPRVPRSDAHMRDNNEQDVHLAPGIEPAA